MLKVILCDRFMGPLIKIGESMPVPEWIEVLPEEETVTIQNLSGTESRPWVKNLFQK